MAVIERVPDVTFQTRVRDESVEGPNPFRWQELSTQELFGGKKVVCSPCLALLPLLALPTTCLATKNSTMSSRPRAWMQLFAFPSTMPL